VQNAVDITNVRNIIKNAVIIQDVVEAVLLKNVHLTATVIVIVLKPLKNVNVRPKHRTNVRRNVAIVRATKFVRKKINMMYVIKLNCSKMVYSTMRKMRKYFSSLLDKMREFLFYCCI
jgi:hypothetical protein